MTAAGAGASGEGVWKSWVKVPADSTSDDAGGTGGGPNILAKSSFAMWGGASFGVSVTDARIAGGALGSSTGGGRTGVGAKPITVQSVAVLSEYCRIYSEQ